jgi:general stress protein YciG
MHVWGYFFDSNKNTNTLSVTEAGRRGGQTVFRKRGREFYRQIGAKGQQKMRERHPNMASQWGKLGGRPRKPSLNEIVGEDCKQR